MMIRRRKMVMMGRKMMMIIPGDTSVVFILAVAPSGAVILAMVLSGMFMRAGDPSWAFIPAHSGLDTESSGKKNSVLPTSENSCFDVFKISTNIYIYIYIYINILKYKNSL